MKKLLLILILTSASMHAMEDAENNVRVVTFDPAKHHDALNLLGSLIDIKPLTDNPTATISVLVPPRCSKHPDTVLGAIVHQTTDHSTKIETEIKALAVPRTYQHNGYGPLLVQHVEQSVKASKEHCLFLQPIRNTQSFYEGLGYAYEDTEIPFYMRKTISKE
jgi:hypothetical protein